jgi:hypothetical protein
MRGLTHASLRVGDVESVVRERTAEDSPAIHRWLNLFWKASSALSGRLLARCGIEVVSRPLHGLVADWEFRTPQHSRAGLFSIVRFADKNQ